MKAHVYAAITADKYELPICICDSAKELAEKFGIKPKSIYESICHKSSGKKRGIKFIRIEI